MSVCVGCQHASQLISLICDHLLCTVCANKTKSIEGQSTIQNKYKIVCPICKRATVTYDINNLLLNKESPGHSNFLFEHLESSQINESSLAEDLQVRQAGYAKIKEFSHRDLKEMSYSQRFNNLTTQRKQSKTPQIPFDRKQNRSKLSHDSGRQNNSKGKQHEEQYSTKCRDHNQNLMFFCETEKRLLCIQCMYKHTREFKSHKVVSIKNSMETIVRENVYYKDETKHRLEYLDDCLKVCQSNKSLLDQAFETSFEVLSEQFNNIYAMLKAREAHLKDTLRTMYTQKQKQITTHLTDVSYIKNCLKQYYNFSFDGVSSEIYFFNSYTLMRDAMSKMNFNFKPIDKESLSVLEKALTPEDIKLAVEKFLYIKKQRKSESRTSQVQHAERNKAALTDEIKNAKKKLEKLEKMEKQEKSNHYLNSYIINLKREDHSQARDRKNSAIEFDSKKTTHKPITPTRVSSKLKSKK